MTSENLASQFADLVSRVQGCTACARMSGSRRVLGPSSGPLSARIMFVGEAPGRLGADAFSIPFHGDVAGDNFERLLEHVGLTRYDVFVTNAVLCNPRDQRGNNATPRPEEIRRCNGFLRTQIDLLNPLIVVTLGAQSLRSLNSIEEHQITLSDGVRRTWPWYGRLLIPAYHPGQRAMIHRSYGNQVSDYQFIAESYRRLLRPQRSGRGTPTPAPVAAVAAEILRFSGIISYFKLHKLFYLVEYEAYKVTGQRLSNAYIIRQKDGPYVTDLHIRRLKKSIPSLTVSQAQTTLLLGLVINSDLFVSNAPEQLRVAKSDSFDIAGVVRKYAHKTDAAIKQAVYMTAPMRTILRKERRSKTNLYNSPIEFGVA